MVWTSCFWLIFAAYRCFFIDNSIMKYSKVALFMPIIQLFTSIYSAKRHIKTELAHFNSYIASGDSFPAASITRNVRKRTIFPKNHCIFVCLE